MPPPVISQMRTQKLLLLQKLLNLRDGASPFTMLLDSLEQSSEPVVREFIQRATGMKTRIVLVSLQTLRKPKDVYAFINALRKPLGELRREIASHLSTPQSPLSKKLLIFDSLNPLAIRFPLNLAAFLSSLLGPTISILATYHTDIPIPQNATASLGYSNPYSPDTLTTLKYLATAILCISNLSQTIEKKKARDRSLEEPVFGLQEGRDGILVGMQKEVEEALDGVVLEMEVRRKSGRAVREAYVLITGMARSTFASNVGPAKAGSDAKICLLNDHPLFAASINLAPDGSDGRNGEGEVETTFNLGLTEQQRKDREDVVLPYFDAQKGEGAGEGGRILYEMDRGDDFDDEEDEI